MKHFKTLFLGLAIILVPHQTYANWFSDTASSIGTSIWNHLPQSFQNSPTLQKWACWLGIGAACYIGARLVLRAAFEDEGDDVEEDIQPTNPVIENKEQKPTVAPATIQDVEKQ
jgi:hypothetical protein